MLNPEEWASLRDYVLARQDSALARLGEIIRIPTVAHPTRPNPALFECAELLAKWLTDLGVRDARIVTPAVNPLVTGSLGDDPDKPTVLVYGHFDVQDPGPVDSWHTPPFEPTVKDERVFARGSGDNKGQFLAHFLAVEAYQGLGLSLPVNLKFLFDGGEEIGSGDFAAFATTEPPELQADLAFTSDGPVHESGRPTLVLGGRGIAYLRVRVQTIRRSTHSQYAPVLPNAARRLLEVLASLWDEDGRVAVPGFYDEVRPPSESDQQLLRNIPSVTGTVIEHLQPRPFADMPSEEYYRRMLMEPVLNIAGLAAGDLTGNQTMVPHEANVKLEALLVPDQRSADIAEKIRRHLVAQGIDESGIELMFTMEPSRTPPDHPMVRAVARALERVWDTEPVVMNRFPSYAPYYLFDRLGMPGFYVAYAQPDQSNHAPNENLSIEYFMNGILSSIAVLDEFGAARERGIV